MSAGGDAAEDLVHGHLDRNDAARGERLPGRILRGAVVLQQHGFLDAFWDSLLAAEHVDDRLPEKRAHGVVRVFVVLRALEPRGDLVAGRQRDGAAAERDILLARAGDRLARRRVLLLLGELDELCILRIDFKCHDVASFR